MVPVLTMTLPANIVFVRAPMALNAVPEIPYSFFDVLTPDLVGIVLVTAVAGVSAVIIALMAGGALDVVVAVEPEVTVVVKGRRGPAVLAMTLATLAFDGLVNSILG